MKTGRLMTLLSTLGAFVAAAWAVAFLPILSLTTEPAPGHAAEAYSVALGPPTVATALFFAAATVGFRRRNEVGARRTRRVAVATVLVLVGVFGVWYTVAVARTITP
jgi:hypothetical protein